MNALNKIIQRTLTALALWAAAGSAMALQWNFSYDFGAGALRSFASGVLTTTDTLVSGTYTITGITGTRTFNSITNTITGLQAPGTFFGNDNRLYPNAPFLNSNGVSFTIDGNNNGRNPSGNQVNVYFTGSGAYGEAVPTVGLGTLSVTPVPEPSTVLLAGAGLAVLLVAGRRRSQQTRRS